MFHCLFIFDSFGVLLFERFILLLRLQLFLAVFLFRLPGFRMIALFLLVFFAFLILSFIDVGQLVLFVFAVLLLVRRLLILLLFLSG